MIHTIITNLHEVATGDADSIKVLNDINAITTSYTVVELTNTSVKAGAAAVNSKIEVDLLKSNAS